MIEILFYLTAGISFLLLLLFTIGFPEMRFVKNNTYNPLVSVIIPNRGLDSGFIEFLKNIKNQDYKNVEYIFCLADKKDLSIDEINKTMEGMKFRIVLSKEIKTCSEMNQNQIAGLEKIGNKCEIICVIDSDGVFDRDYIRKLIEPLQDQEYIISSSYRIIEAKGFGGLVSKYWNLFGLRIKEIPGISWAWGGGFAFRKSDLNKLGIPNIWINSISDDQPLNTSIQKIKGKTYYVKNYCTSYVEKSFIDSAKWITRQQFMMQKYNKFSHFISQIVIGLLWLSLFSFLIFGNSILLVPFTVLFLSVFVFSIRYGSLKEIILSPFLALGVLIATTVSLILPRFQNKVYWGPWVYTVDSSGKVTDKKSI